MKRKRIILGITVTLLAVCTTVFQVGATDSPIPENPIVSENEIDVNDYGDAKYMVTEYDFASDLVVEISNKGMIQENSPDLETTEPFDVEKVSSMALKNLESETCPFGIIGEDGRSKVTDTTANPFRKIVYMRIVWKDGTSATATGFMIGKSAVATAGHAVYSKAHGGFASSITIWPGKNENKVPYGSASATKVSVPKVYYVAEDARYDAAVFKINKQLGTTTGYFGLRRQNEAFTKEVYVTGYPGDHIGQMWKMKDTPRTTTKYRITYNIDTFNGQSGSPIYRVYNGKWYVIGIHTNAWYNNSGKVYKNSGVIFHPIIYSMLKSYI